MFNTSVYKYLAAIAIFSSVVIMTGACSTKLKLPNLETDMKKVYLIKYTTWGHHSLAFYTEGLLTEYTYGDWELFALNKRDGWTAWKNMTFLTQGALGRKSTAWRPGESFCEKFEGCEAVVGFFAPTKKVIALQNKLDIAYQDHSNTEVYNSVERVNFVKYDVSYWAFHNCNHELVDWLELIGAEVSGKVFYQPDFIGGMHPKQVPLE